MARPLVIAHRTNMDTSLENSLEGIAAALADGVDAIEVDASQANTPTKIRTHLLRLKGRRL